MSENPPDFDETELWQQVLGGDQQAFEAVYRACSAAVYGLCLRMTSNPAIADDCTQATFVQAWVKRSSFRFDAKLKTWLHRIAVNEVLGRGRSEGRLKDAMAVYAQESATHRERDEFSTPSAGTDVDLERAIAELPERSRQVFVLHAIHGYKHDEVGEMMGIAAGTSKAHFHRSRELLQTALDMPPAGATS